MERRRPDHRGTGSVLRRLVGRDGGERGKLVSVAALIETHCGAIEADFARYYGLELADLWRDNGTLTHRRVGVLVRYLPSESATQTEVRDSLTEDELDAIAAPESHGAWSHGELLLAAISDALNVLVWQNGRLHGKSKAKAPEPIRRPGVRSTRREPQISEAGVSYLSELRERRRQRGDSGRIS